MPTRTLSAGSRMLIRKPLTTREVECCVVFTVQSISLTVAESLVNDVSWVGVWSGLLSIDEMNDINCLTKGDLLSWSDFTTEIDVTRSVMTCEEFDTLGQA